MLNFLKTIWNGLCYFFCCCFYQPKSKNHSNPAPAIIIAEAPVVANETGTSQPISVSTADINSALAIQAAPLDTRPSEEEILSELIAVEKKRAVILIIEIVNIKLGLITDKIKELRDITNATVRTPLNPHATCTDTELLHNEWTQIARSIKLTYRCDLSIDHSCARIQRNFSTNTAVNDLLTQIKNSFENCCRLLEDKLITAGIIADNKNAEQRAHDENADSDDRKARARGLRH